MRVVSVNITNELLLGCIERDVIKTVLGTKVVSEALVKLNSEDSKEQNKLKELLVNESIKRKLRILKGELADEEEKKKYAVDFLSVLLDKRGVKEKKLDEVTKQMKLNEVSYYLKTAESSSASELKAKT